MLKLPRSVACKIPYTFGPESTELGALKNRQLETWTPLAQRYCQPVLDGRAAVGHLVPSKLHEAIAEVIDYLLINVNTLNIELSSTRLNHDDGDAHWGPQEADWTSDSADI
nr:hypothetical protein CFP56_73661 [Quercus suber]